MPSPGEPTKPPLPAEEAFLDLLVETLEGMDRPARAHFLQRFFKAVAQLELSDPQSLDLWEQILARRRELAETLGQRISWKTALMDVLASTERLRVPILMEYEDLKKLQINAATDPLTGLYNRRLFEEYFDKELNRARRNNQPLALVLMDLHRFKEVNDRYGHPQGDQVLQAAASTLRKALRTSDYAFRIGGDEFALLLPQSDADQAATLSRRVRGVFDAAVEPLRRDVALGLDYGVAIYPQDGDQKEVLLRVADERLYELKQTVRAQLPDLPPLRPAPAPPPKPPAEPPRPQPEAVPPQPAAERRKWERVYLEGTRSYAQLSETPGRTARVLDLSYGGVALETETPEPLGASFQAVLHVPILPPVRVSLRQVYFLPRTGAGARVGCSFIS